MIAGLACRQARIWGSLDSWARSRGFDGSGKVHGERQTHNDKHLKRSEAKRIGVPELGG